MFQKLVKRSGIITISFSCNSSKKKSAKYMLSCQSHLLVQEQVKRIDVPKIFFRTESLVQSHIDNRRNL